MTIGGVGAVRGAAGAVDELVFILQHCSGLIVQDTQTLTHLLPRLREVGTSLHPCHPALVRLPVAGVMDGTSHIHHSPTPMCSARP